MCKTKMKIKFQKIAHRHCSGSAMVEAAMVLPIFLIILFGTFEVGRILYTIHGLDVSARGGARRSVSEIGNQDAINLAVATTRDVLATFNLNDTDGVGNFKTSVTAAVVQVQGRDAVQVSVNRMFNFLFTRGYLINVGSVQLFPANIPLTSVATMRKEG